MSDENKTTINAMKLSDLDLLKLDVLEQKGDFVEARSEAEALKEAINLNPDIPLESKKQLIEIVEKKINIHKLTLQILHRQIDISSISTMISKPFHPSNAFTAEEVAKERIKFNKAYIGSCTNGGYEDLFQAAFILYQARKKGINKISDGIDLVVFPGSRQIKHKIEEPDSRLKGESIAQIFYSVGGEIRDSWCGPCFGQGADALKSGETAITSFNRNWQNRMGRGGLGYLASPMVVASSALIGYMAPPSELELAWEPTLMDS